jgi:hypothetical protein
VRIDQTKPPVIERFWQRPDNLEAHPLPELNRIFVARCDEVELHGLETQSSRLGLI